MSKKDKKEQKDLALIICMYVGLFMLVGLAVNVALADEMTFKFKSPSFSGVNTSQHYLTIENQEHSREKTLVDELKALADEQERDEQNTTIARFIRNLESRVYAKLSSQLVESLFGETASKSGSIELEGNTIEYEADDEFVILKVTDPLGKKTTITFPLNSFTF